MALPVGEQAPAGFAERAVVADRGEGVLQRAAAAHVHVHIAAGHQWNALVAAETTQALQARAVVGLAVQLDCQPQPLRKAGLQPLCILDARGRVCPQAQQARMQLFHVAVQAAVLALGRAPAAGRDQLAQRGVAALVGAQQHQFRAVLQLEFGPGDQGQCVLLRGLPGAHDAGQRALIGDRQRVIALALGTREQLLGDGRTALETEGRQAMQLGVPGQRCAHANQPCSMNGPLRASAAVYAQPRWPCVVSMT
ncbi:hypothetical protein D3C71_1366180 [compost metagenome]